MEGFFILAVIFAFVIILVWMDNRKRERMFLLKQGKDPNIIETKLPQISTTSNYMKWGIIIIGIGLGALLGTLFSNGRYGLYLAFLLIFSGIGLIVSYIVTKNTIQPDNTNRQKEHKEEISEKEDQENTIL